MDLFKKEVKKEKNVFGFKSLKKVEEIADHQTGKSNKKRDKRRKAMPPGKRISKTGNVYYEYRRNRSDMPGKKL